MKKIWRFGLAGIVLALVFGLPLGAADSQAAIAKLAAAFKSGTFNDGAGTLLPYRFFEPVKTKGKHLPLVLYLHGDNEAGSDNSAQLTKTECATIWTEADHQQTNPCYVLAPQLPQGKSWTDDSANASVLSLLKKFQADHPDVDAGRIYLVGFEMGGSATWKLAIKKPSLFAALLVFAANADAYSADKNALVPLKNLPIMVVHSIEDPTIPMDSASKMVTALTDAGNVSIQYHQWQKGSYAVPHNSWYPAFHNYEVVYNFPFLSSQASTFYGEIAPYKTFVSKSLGNGITQIWDLSEDTAFVVERSDKALVVDSTQGTGNLFKYIRDNVLVNKYIPMEGAVTHNNGDHVKGYLSFNGEDQVKKFYMHKDEWNYSVVSSSIRDFNKVQFLNDGDTFQLGGKPVQTIQVPGHPFGGLCYLYENYLFTGDAIGSGDAYLQNSEMSMEEWVVGAQRLADKVKNIKNLIVYVGHTGEVRGSDLGMEFVNQAVACAKGIVDGSLPITEYRRRVAAYATVGRASIVFQKWNIKPQKANMSLLFLKTGKGADIPVPTQPGRPNAVMPDITKYEVTVANDVDKISIRPTTNKPSKTVTLAAGSNRAVSLPWREPILADLAIGSNTFTIVVTEGTLSNTYTLIVNRKK